MFHFSIYLIKIHIYFHLYILGNNIYLMRIKRIEELYSIYTRNHKIKKRDSKVSLFILICLLIYCSVLSIIEF